MPRPLDPRIAEVLRKYGEDPTDTKTVLWDCHGTWVVYHQALERVAARAGITFEMPQILRAERDEAVILASGALDSRKDWEIGECLVGVNYRVSPKQAAYVYAMATKRARDRLILKLIGLHGLLYSEEEADDFKRGKTNAVDDYAPVESKERYLEECRHWISTGGSSYPDLVQWWKDEAQARRDFDLSQDDVNELKALVTAKAPREAA